MALRKSQQLLPEVFRTKRNNKFLNATVDQLISEPTNKKINSFIGRRFSPNFQVGDSYVQEISNLRKNYQLEPAVVYRDTVGEVQSVSGIIDFLNSISFNNGQTNNHNTLFEQEYYNWSSFVDLDKLINYGEYFWLPNGPDSVNVFGSTVDTTEDYSVLREGTTYRQIGYEETAYDETGYDQETSEIVSGNAFYRFNNSSAQSNETLYFARGGTYTFTVNQPGIPFWIQTETGLSGISSYAQNISTREIAGVDNNGEDVGVITFNVPLADDQTFFTEMTLTDQVDLCTTLTYSDLHNQVLSTFIDTYGGIDTFTEINGKTIVFLNETDNESAWDQGDLFDAYGFDSATENGLTGSFDTVTRLDIADRYDVFKINVVTIAGVETITLTRVTDIPNLTKVKIKQGKIYGNREIYKRADGKLELIPNITSTLETLYYQDGVDANRFGRIVIVDAGASSEIDVENDILGKTGYISPNGVVFTNGLKVEFDTTVTPTGYQNKTYYVEGVGTSIVLVDVDSLTTPEKYTVNSSEGFDSTLYDVGNYDGTLNSPTLPDYIIANRSCIDRNAWARSNRWFHRQVIEATAAYNDFVSSVDDSARARRPIIEFIPNLTLFNMGITSKDPVTIIDTEQNDALSNVNGTTGYFADGIDLTPNMTVVFANDTDANIRNKIYRVDFIDQDSDADTDKIINLVEVDTVVENDCVLANLGANNQGLVYYYSSGAWTLGQQKTSINQEPLFDVYDGDHTSFSNTTKYPSTNFAGCKLFSYKRSTSADNDSVLNFGLTYKNFSNIGDIVFENNFVNDKFSYTKQNGQVQVLVKSGHVHKYNTTGTVRSLLNGWTQVAETSKQYQIVEYTVDEELYTFEIGSEPADTVENSLLVYVNGVFQTPDKYSQVDANSKYFVVFDSALAENDVVAIKVFSTGVNPLAYYEVARNLENNADNQDFASLTLGQIRNHLVESSRRIRTLSGPALGSNNLRDIDYTQYPGKILQHSAGAVLPFYLLTDSRANAISAMKFSMEEYTRFKNKFVDNIDKLDLDLRDIQSCVDDILEFMVGSKTAEFPFYYSDMLPWGSQKSLTTVTVDDASERIFEFANQFDLTSLSQRGVLVYLTRGSTKTQLLEGVDYTFDVVEPAITLVSTYTLQVNDVIDIYEYTNTDGSFVPPTPTKLGLWPKFTPSLYIDNTYATPKTVVRGHDGSTWVGYGDVRDQIVLELEKRIYNNIKTQYDSDLFDFSTVIPGYWRSTPANRNANLAITRSMFGAWTQKNRLNASENTTYDAANAFSWNYKNSTEKLTQTRIPGGWRGIYRWLYDTDTPHTTPWEMLGLSQKPRWWDDRYGEAPYTSGNSVLWEDLRDGKLYSNALDNSYVILTNYKRPGLMDVIPVNEQGTLMTPNEFLTIDATVANTNTSWSYGDVGPVESAWRRSSEWPFAAQIIAALSKPARYLSMMYDTNLLEIRSDFSQILRKDKSYRPNIGDYQMHGVMNENTETVNRVEGYNQFIYNYLKYMDFDAANVNTRIQNLELNLCYKLAGYSDKKFLKVLAESASPTSSNQTIFIPDEDYSIITAKSVPLELVVYSGIKIIRRQIGYEISGYDNENPYFRIIPSVNSNNRTEKTIGNTTLFFFNDYNNYTADIPYGTVLTSEQQVVDLMVAYQRYLESKGLVFNQSITDDSRAKDFSLVAEEFIFWSQQNWPVDSVFSASPSFDELTVSRAFTTTDDFTKSIALRDANSKPINKSDFNIERIDNTTTITVNTDKTVLYSAVLNPIQYEHVIVFNNSTIFNDVLYQPELGNRQERMKLMGFKVGGWNGTLHAPGFLINEDRFHIWQANRDYKKGDFVSFRDKIYVAVDDHDGKSTFDYEDWIESKNQKVGLLPNISNKADRFQNFFDVDGINLESSTDKAGKGLIGFRNRNYLENLGLDDVSQVKFYQGLIKGKGTGETINKLIKADLTNLNQEIDFYEEWAFRVGEYGSIDSNQVVEFVLDELLAQNNPTVVEFLNAGETGTKDYISLQRKDLYRVPNNFTKNLFKTRTQSSKNDITSAGYPRLDDIDLTLFDINNIQSLNDSIDQVGRGTKIWVAKTTTSWDVLRATETDNNIIEVESSTNGLLTFKMQKNHSLAKDDHVVVKSNEVYGGFYKITSAANASFTVESDVEFEDAITDLSIPVFKLESVRFTQNTGLADFTPAYGWNKNEIIWVDQDESLNWKSYKKAEPWSTPLVKSSSLITGNGNFGSSVSVSKDSLTSLVGSPESGIGFVTPYVLNNSRVLVETNPITVGDIGSTVDGFGYSVTSGDQWHAIGAPDTYGSRGAAFIYYRDSGGVFNLKQVLYVDSIPSSSQYGYTVAMSGDERYLFVGAPGNDTVYVYGYKSVLSKDEQIFTITGDGSTAIFTLDFTPQSDISLLIEDGNGKVYIPYKDYTVSGSNITFTSAPANGLSVVVRQTSHYEYITSITGSDTSTGDRFGESVDCDYTGSTLVVGAPNAEVADSTSTVYTDAGEVYVFSNIVQTFTGNGTTSSFTTDETIGTVEFVTVNGTTQVLADGEFGGFASDSSENRYTRSTDTISFRYIPASGDVIKVYTGNFAEVQKIDQNITGQQPTDSELFGTSVAVDPEGVMIAVGSPGEDETNPNTGSVLVFTDTGLRYGNVVTNSSSGLSYTSGDTIYINDYKIEITSTDTTASGLVSIIDAAGISLVDAEVGSTSSLVSVASTSLIRNRKLKIRPGSGTSYRTGIKFEPYRFTQKINHPSLIENENFGQSVAFDKHMEIDGSSSQNLIISSDRASTFSRTRFDLDTITTSPAYGEYKTTFDDDSTKFVDRIVNSGAVYVYEMFDAVAPEGTANTPKFVYGQQLQSTDISYLDQFGSAIFYYDDKIIVGAPLDDAAQTNGGGVYEFTNSTRASVWQTWRSEEAKVDIERINRVVDYNIDSDSIINFIDYIDPYKQKLAGPAQAELDYITLYDPAFYSVSTNNTQAPQASWNNEQVGKVWWDLSTAAVLDYEQGELDYRSTYWGQFFPGSSIDVYEWVESSVLPSQYTGEGTPKHPDDSSYSVAVQFNPATGTSVTRYYFWVKDRISVPEVDFRSISTTTVAQLIEDPKAAGIKFIEILSPSAIALVNIKDDLQDDNVVLSINYDVVANEGILHSEFDLVAEGDAEQAIPTRIYNKLVDSLAGQDSQGNSVPDATLSDAEKYGIQIRPRQTMFENRRRALQVFVDYCNSVFRSFPVVRQSDLSGLSASEAEPTSVSGEWNRRVNTVVERDYLNTKILQTGYKVLVAEDENYDGLWTIYRLEADKTWFLHKIQSYDTAKFWEYATWYAEGYSETTIPNYQVTTEAGLLTLTPEYGEVAKVLSNDDGNNSYFVYESPDNWREVIIEQGTVQLKSSIYDYRSAEYGSFIGFDNDVFDFSYYDKIPVQEVRNIVNAVKNNIFVDALAIYFNRLFFRLIEYSLHENVNQVDWVFKTSFIRVLHKLRDLDQYPTFRNDNSEFIEEYINEVKPYHTKIREYVAKFAGDDNFQGDVTDFDIHAFYDTNLGYFRKPSGDYAGDEILRTQGLNNPWSQNYSYYLDSIEIYAPGSGYIADPIITISEPDLETGVRATAVAVSNTDEIIRVTVTNKGSGYTTTPTITVNGAGTGAILLPRMKNNAVREFDITMKFDRVTYSSTVKDWAASTSYDYLDLVAYKNSVTGVQELYQVIVTGGFTSGATFSVEDTSGAIALDVYSDEDLTNNADRIAAYYTPASGMLGDQLDLLQRGTDYTGVKVTGPGFDREPGFDVAGFDNVPFDDFEIDTDGLTVLSGSSSLDTIIKSTFADLALGTRPEDIDVNGGGFVDEYNSHAPEEVVPGIVFDTLDMEVYTDPSDDFEWDGNGFEIVYRSYEADGTTDTFSFTSGEKREDVDNIYVWINQTPQRTFTIDYFANTITLPSTPSLGETVYIYGYGNTGERMVHEETFVGDGSTINFTMGINYDLALQTLVLINGVRKVPTVDYTVLDVDNKTLISFDNAPANADHMHVFVYNKDVSRQAYTEVNTQAITLASGTTTYDLDKTVLYTQPFEGNVVVELNNLRLRPTNAKYYTADGSTATFTIPGTAGEGAVPDGDIKVSVISRDDRSTVNPQNNKIANIDYVVNPSDGSSLRTVTFFTAPSGGDTVIVAVRTGAEYQIDSDSITINSGVSFNTGDKLYVTTFANHDPLRIQTKVFEGLGSDIVETQVRFDSGGYDSDSFDEIAITGLSPSKYTLDRSVNNLNYLWVTLNGVKLHPGQFTIDGSGRLDLTGETIDENSVIIVTHFTENVIQPTVGFRIFKNMLGDFDYTRIAADNIAILAVDLEPTDTKIYVDDASKLPTANTSSKQPGVVFIGNERVTYWEINYEENYITNIRRSTEGTRFATIHRVGTRVVDSGLDQALPATDTHTKTWYDLGSGTAANGAGIQAATTVNANFLKAKEAYVPSYLTELNAGKYIVDDYVVAGYVEERS